MSTLSSLNLPVASLRWDVIPGCVPATSGALWHDRHLGQLFPDAAQLVGPPLEVGPSPMWGTPGSLAERLVQALLSGSR